MKPLQNSKLNTKWNDFKAFLTQQSVGIHTGIPCLDNYLLGLGGVVNIQGETSSCKSSLGLQIAHHALKQGYPVLMIDKENGEGRVITRLLCQANRISRSQFLAATEEQQREYVAKINDYKFHIHTEPILKLDDLETRIKEMDKLYKLPFVVLFDSIQAADRIDDNDRLSLENWVYFLDRMKLEMQGRATLIFVSEINRSSYGTQGAGKGKGSNVVDYKPETLLDIKWNDTSDTYTVKVCKHRDGLKGAKFELRKLMSQPEDNRSFTFLLEETELESDTCGLDDEVI